MKGSIISVIEVMLTGIILILAFYHFFPQYVIRSKWDRVLLSVKVMDTLKTIDDLDRTYEFAVNTSNFNSFMGRVLKPEYHGALVWWKETKDLEGYTEDMEIPYFTEAQKETIVDVEIHPYEYSVDSNTVALWHFNEGSGDITYDNTTNGNNGTLQGGMDLTGWTTNCMFGSCLKFDGSDDYVEVDDDSTLDFGASDSFTAEAWFKTESNENMRIVYKWSSSGYAIFIGLINPGNVVGIIWYAGSPRSIESDGWNDGKWHHVAFVRNVSSSYIYLYVDGILRDSDIDPGGSLENPGNLYIGCDWQPDYFFNGTIDEVRILNRALSDDEVRADFNRLDVYSLTLGLGYPY